jgi:hypothetical protein
MRRILATIAFLLLAVSFVAAQGNSNGNSNNGNPASNGVNNVWGYVPGGAIPQALAVHIIQEARAWGQANFGLGLGQMMQLYREGELTIAYVPVVPPILMFRVSYGGNRVVVIDSF